jgi:hypothetical protein
MRLFSYKMTSDAGFAPNPFGEHLTLATCKPQIRRTKKVGDWLAGFTSLALNGDKVGKERLVYVMKVTKKLSIEEYWESEEFQYKKPKIHSEIFEERTGDNIYKPAIVGGKNDFVQIENLYHNSNEDKLRDTGGEYVLISDEFYYFGCKPLKIPVNLRPNIPKGQSANGSLTTDDNLIIDFMDFVMEKSNLSMKYKPHRWFENDKKYESCSK